MKTLNIFFIISLFYLIGLPKDRNKSAPAP